MFTAQAYSVCVTSLGAILGEEHLCREVIARWNQSRSREAGRVLLPLQGADTHRPDLYVVLIGSYVDAAKAEAILSTGARVVMMFSTWHDPDSTLPSEVLAA